MLWSVDSCQNSVSADQYRLTVSWAQVSTRWVRMFFWIYPLTSYYFYMHSLLTFLTMVTRWSPSSSNFYALIGQKLTGEFIRKMYAASGTCFLIAEADRVLCSQLVMLLTVFFHWITKWIQLLWRFFCNSWFVYWIYVWQMRRLSKSSEIQFRMALFSFFTLLDA